MPPPKSPRGPNLRAAVAGSLLIGTLLLCAAVGLALGAVFGLPVLGLFVGLFAGFPLGVLVVRTRFRDL